MKGRDAGTGGKGGRGFRRRLAGWVVGLFAATGVVSNSPAAEREAVIYARTNFQAAETRYQSEPLSHEVTWRFARACFDLADISTNKAERADIAQKGIAACEQLVARAPHLLQAHYYLGMNLGELAQTKGLGALKLVRQMEREFALTRKLDEHFDYAGSDRNLGLLYRDAPAIASIGSRTKARAHLRRAVELAPDYPENRLDLIEAYVGWGDEKEAQRELQALEALWPRARTNLTGPAFAADWDDWGPRLNKVKARLRGD